MDIANTETALFVPGTAGTVDVSIAFMWREKMDNDKMAIVAIAKTYHEQLKEQVMATRPAIPTNSELANEVRPHLSEFANELTSIQARPYSYARRQAAEDLMERTDKFVKWWHTRTEPLRKTWTEACKLDSDVAKSVEKINDAARRIIGGYDHAGLCVEDDHD